MANSKIPHIALVVTRGPLPGKISAVQKVPAEWGRKEKPPTFIHVPLLATPEEVQWLRANGVYDFDRKTFQHKETGEDFDSEHDIVEDAEYNQDLERCRALAIRLNGGVEPVGDPCTFLRAKHLPDGKDDRRHFMELFWPHRKRPGVRALLKAAKRGLYPDSREAFLALSPDVQAAILATLPRADALYLRWICLGEGDRGDD